MASASHSSVSTKKRSNDDHHEENASMKSIKQTNDASISSASAAVDPNNNKALDLILNIAFPSGDKTLSAYDHFKWSKLPDDPEEIADSEIFVGKNIIGLFSTAFRTATAAAAPFDPKPRHFADDPVPARRVKTSRLILQYFSTIDPSIGDRSKWIRDVGAEKKINAHTARVYHLPLSVILPPSRRDLSHYRATIVAFTSVDGEEESRGWQLAFFFIGCQLMAAGSSDSHPIAFNNHFSYLYTHNQSYPIVALTNNNINDYSTAASYQHAFDHKPSRHALPGVRLSGDPHPSVLLLALFRHFMHYSTQGYPPTDHAKIFNIHFHQEEGEEGNDIEPGTPPMSDNDNEENDLDDDE